MKLVSSKPMGKRRVYDIEVSDVHNFYANGVNVHNCATDGGVSVIKDDGTVVDIGSALYPFLSVEFRDNLLFTSNSSSGGHTRIFEVDKLNADWASPLKTYEYWGVPYITQKSTWSSGKVALPTREQEFAQITNANKLTLVGSYLQSTGVPVAENEDLASYITSTYNTGWMNGDIKLATLSDTDDTDLVGSELVTNGTFDTDLSGWTVTAGSDYLSVSGGVAISDTTSGSGGVSPTLSQTITTEIGKTYTLNVTGLQVTEGYWTQVLVDSVVALQENSGTSDVGDYDAVSNTGQYTWTATKTSYNITWRSRGDNTRAELDSISVRLAEPDRSVNGNGLQVFGTVQKNPVATGADLVAYRGFSSINYLKQPYNSDLDFGTGDFCISYWMYKSASSFAVFSRTSGSGADYGDDPNHFTHFIDANFKIRIAGGNITTSTSGLGITDYTWVKIDVIRRASVLYVYVNGVQKFTQSYETPDVSCPDLPMYLGVLYYNNFTNSGMQNKLALFRMSGTAPTAEQIKKIYEDEKVLFQENAQATLHGTSDAVTALAYDDTTELLHVGTSAGRSVFQGLRRVDNTTDAVGVAISASNGLVAEE